MSRSGAEMAEVQAEAVNNVSARSCSPRGSETAEMMHHTAGEQLKIMLLQTNKITFIKK